MTRILEGKLPNFNADVTPQPKAFTLRSLVSQKLSLDMLTACAQRLGVSKRQVADTVKQRERSDELLRSAEVPFRFHIEELGSAKALSS